MAKRKDIVPTPKQYAKKIAGLLNAKGYPMTQGMMEEIVKTQIELEAALLIGKRKHGFDMLGKRAKTLAEKTKKKARKK